MSDNHDNDNNNDKNSNNSGGSPTPMPATATTRTDPSVLDGLDLPRTLEERIQWQHSSGNGESDDDDDVSMSRPPLPLRSSGSLVLYLPTVVLRKEHNPGYALACRLANHHGLPLVVLAVALDDHSLPSHHCCNKNSNATTTPVVGTARRLAFVLEAIRSAGQEWQDHGAGVAIRIHAPQHRTPHHLTMATRLAAAVVTDEPFVHPALQYVETVERACRAACVPCLRVDGSTTVPPRCKLRRKRKKQTNHDSTNASQQQQQQYYYWDGVPSKAWVWQKMTNGPRRPHVWGAAQHGQLDAPPLQHRLPDGFFLQPTYQHLCPSPDWQDTTKMAPGQRPWSVQEMLSIPSMKEYVTQQNDNGWLKVDQSVPPCVQTDGSSTAALRRWQHFRRYHLAKYAKTRNNIRLPHAVSRLSCYLNYGILSIFRVVAELWQDRYDHNSKSKAGAIKFDDEIIKWREIGYAHAFANPQDYQRATSLPAWARQDLASFMAQSTANIGSHHQQLQQQGEGGNNQGDMVPNNNHNNNSMSFSISQLETGSTTDATWNAMQQYLVHTGELHNNARMTWGKTVVHWQKHSCCSIDELLGQLVYLNDRYALDGLSPPSYAGLLWCCGWGDKPSNDNRNNSGKSVSTKPASRYRTAPEGFVEAEQLLLAGDRTMNMNEENGGVSSSSSSSLLSSRVQSSMEAFLTPNKKQKKMNVSNDPKHGPLDRFLTPRTKGTGDNETLQDGSTTKDDNTDEAPIHLVG